MATKKTVKQGSGAKKTAAKKGASKASHSMPKAGRDPKGGLTAKGREYFNKTEGSHLRPGVQGPADTPEKMVRKGSFLRRHFTHPRGPMKNDKGEPTRLALSAHAWGEPVPKTLSDAKRLAAKGHELLEQYHEIRDGQKAGAKQARAGSPSKPAAKRSAKAASKETAAKKGASKKVSGAKQTAAKSAARKEAPGRKRSAKKVASKRAPR